MQWVCVRCMSGRDCNWVLAHSSGQIVPGRAGSWREYQQPPLLNKKSRDLGPQKLKYCLLAAIILIFYHLPCRESGVEEVKLDMNVMVDTLEICISNLSAGRAHYEKYKLDMSGLKE
jgi:hypothetical protein